VSFLVDREDLVGRLFFPTQAISPAPAGAVDTMLSVPGATLHLRRHAALEKDVLLLCHGNGETVAAWDAAGQAFAKRGWSLAAWDYRGYGRSSGASTFRRMLEDGEQVREEVQRWAPRRLVVLGRSLGSRVAWELAGHADGVVIDSGFTDVDAFVRRRGLDPAALPADERALIDPLACIRAAAAPVLLLHGEADRAIAVDEAVRAQEACRGTLVRLPGVGHDDLHRHPDYDLSLRRFLGTLTRR
jgi:pimeloyl-ACP methyl ester carboxylesterase